MSRGQKRRVPANFPRMRYRARKRHLWTIVRLDGPPYIYIGPIGGQRRALKNGGGWLLPEDNPLDPSAWLEGARDA